MSDEPVSTVTWMEPPPRRGARYDWKEVAAQLRSRPNEWAQVFERDKVSLVTAIRLGGIKALKREDGFITRTTNNKRSPENGRTCSLFMMYTGNGE